MRTKTKDPTQGVEKRCQSTENFQGKHGAKLDTEGVGRSQ